MWLILGALVAGGLLGWFNLLPAQIYDWTGKITVFGLAVLLFSMGVGIGSNEQILKHLDTLGLKALAISFFSVLGSILVTWYLQKKILGGKNQ